MKKLNALNLGVSLKREEMKVIKAGTLPVDADPNAICIKKPCLTINE